MPSQPLPHGHVLVEAALPQQLKGKERAVPHLTATGRTRPPIPARALEGTLSSLRRLLVHGIAQYHGLASFSRDAAPPASPPAAPPAAPSAAASRDGSGASPAAPAAALPAAASFGAAAEGSGGADSGRAGAAAGSVGGASSPLLTQQESGASGADECDPSLVALTSGGSLQSGGGDGGGLGALPRITIVRQHQQA